MPTQPKVSVVIPTYNQGHLLQEAINSVLAQTFTDFELIVVDNCSVDNTPAVMALYRTNQRIHYLRNPHTLPMHENWNKGIELARGTYLKMLCSDDVLLPLALEQMVAALDADAGVAVVSTGRKYMGEKDREFVLPWAGKYAGAETAMNTLRTYNWLASPSTVMLRRKSFDQTGGFGPYRWITDWDMWVRHLLLGQYFAIPEILVYERVHNGSVTRSFNMNMIKLKEEYLLFRSVYCGAYSGYFLPYQKELKMLLRKKVLQSSAYMFSRIPKLHQAKDRQAFQQMFALVRREGMLAKATLHWLKKKLPVINKFPEMATYTTSNT